MFVRISEFNIGWCEFRMRPSASDEFQAATGLISVESVIREFQMALVANRWACDQMKSGKARLFRALPLPAKHPFEPKKYDAYLDFPTH